MNELIDKTVECPYCGENIDVLVDQSEEQQNYIEDCQVCCRPIVFNVTVDSDGDANITVNAENE
jgi:hypothetical protein